MRTRRESVRRLAGLLLTLAIALGAAPAGAHAIVTGSSLERQPVRAHVATTVLLSFNSGIEVGLSRVDLVRKGDRQQPLPIGAGKRPGELRVSLPPLDPGDYALKFRIFAADGHFTEDVLRFRVAE